MELRPGFLLSPLSFLLLSVTSHVRERTDKSDTDPTPTPVSCRVDTVDMIKPDATIILRNAKIDMFKVDMMKPDATIILRNAKIDMFKGSMRLAVDKWGRVEVTEPASFIVKEDNNLSLVEYELVNVVEEWLVQM
ncbi:uncharacterized protein At4g28440-like [Camellia sinensis]|uniref:uncharacterized protein At4g28440-like n=1 Tax=Camellia sinensis TaxID=4442 RepID=UPI00103578CD|nr:uncharacterized protein At4g28440-like [Camellia sinensis]